MKNKTPWQNTVLAVLTFGGGTALLFVLTFVHINQGDVSIPVSLVVEALTNPQDILAHHTVRILRMPRAVMGILAGGALAVSGVVLQTVTKNPLASASTLGIHAGTYFAVVAGTVFIPAALSANSLLTAFIGGLGTFLIVYMLSGGKKATPVRMVLAGMIVTLLFSSMTNVLQIFYEQETAGLFLWGSGTLVQNDWTGAQFAAPFIFVSLAVILILSSQLDTLKLGDDVAAGLGQNVHVVKIVSITAAVMLTSVTVSVVGPIGFVGLIAPHIIKLLGYRRHVLVAGGSFIWGGNVLLFADILARIIDPSFSELPVGAISALIGAPWLIWLVLRMQQRQSGQQNASVMAGRPTRELPLTILLPVLIVLIAVMGFISLASGNYGFEPVAFFQAVSGSSNEFMKNLIVDFRLSRALLACLAGMILAASGLVFQGVLRNPLADPSVIGITSGGGAGALLAMYVFGASGVWIPAGAMAGSILFFFIVMLFAVRAGFQPATLALLGIGVSAFGTAVIQILVVQADVTVTSALTWLSGTTYAKGWSEITTYLIWPVLFVFPFLLLRIRVLDTLALGDDTAKGLGLNVMQTRFQMASAAALLASLCVAAVGSIGFIGLIAPHAARLLVGPSNQRLLPVSILIGGLLLLAADTLSRTLLAPDEIPSGTIVAIIGAPYFLWLMRKSG
ncbi:iron ABC transporter permease [Salibacterium halotolerans]|uniref:Iron complex transport system permease protein n=1 Tax=Salibacterium halotolerans TaxID=1884432 RepID=A0A1I5TQD7_9BACI|nr:iron ABC transporter permease [Salibacterium halotolerans]SFP85198.1 iron complex transport system permease protein [Salibacterium halotolerans]